MTSLFHTRRCISIPMPARMHTLLAIVPILVYCVSLSCYDLKAQEVRGIDGEYKGLKSTLYFFRSKNNKAITIWNKENKLFKEPMMYPKGKLIAPDYFLIDTRLNLGIDPFSKRFPTNALYEARKAAYKVMNEINQDVFGPKKLEKLRADSASIGITYYVAPNGLIKEIEFFKALHIDITPLELEGLESEIKRRLIYATENPGYKDGNYIKTSSGWSFYIH